jgi:hypothetical protein
MKPRVAYLISALLLLPLAQAAEREEGRFMAKPLKGDYYVYGGEHWGQDSSDAKGPEAVVDAYRAVGEGVVRPHRAGCERRLRCRPWPS